MNNSNTINKLQKKEQVVLVLKTIGLVVVNFLLALAFVRGSGDYLESKSNSSTPWLKNRVTGIIKYFSDQPIAKGYQILYMGASDIQLAINPALIDSHLLEKGYQTKSFNLGVANFDGQLLYLLARRLHEIVNINKRPIDMIAVKFTPLRATYRYMANVQNHYFRHFEDVESIIYSNTMLAEDFKKAPEESSEIWYVKNILGEAAPSSFVSYIYELIWKALPTIEVESSKSQIPDLLKITWGAGLLNRYPAWNSELRGYNFFGYPENKELIEKTLTSYKTPKNYEDFQYFHNYSGDLFKLRLSPKAIKSYIKAINELRKITPNVILLYFPESADIHRDPSAFRNIENALAVIQKQTGVKLMNLNQGNTLEPDDYFDGLHLNQDGQRKLANRLAVELPAYLHDYKNSTVQEKNKPTIRSEKNNGK